MCLNKEPWYDYCVEPPCGQVCQIMYIYCIHPISVPPHSYFSSTPPSRAFTKFWRSSTQSSTSSSSSTLSTWEPTRQVPDHHPAKSCVQCSFIQVHFGCWNSTTKVTNYMKAQGWETDEEGESKSKLFPHNSLVLHRFLSFLGRFHFSVARVPRALECQIEKSPRGEGRGGKPVGNHHLDFAHHSAKVFGQYSAQRLHDSDLDQWLGKKDNLRYAVESLKLTWTFLIRTELTLLARNQIRLCQFERTE